MNRSSVVAWCLVCLLSGVLIGSRAWPWTPTAQAKAVDLATAERLVEQLRAKDTPLHQAGEVMSKIIQVTSPSVVHIQAQRKTKSKGLIEETGSGVVMRSQKASGLFAITNRHVIEGADLDDIYVHLIDGREVHPTEVWTDQPTDVAVLRLNVSDVMPGRWGDSTQLEIGHVVLAVGSPFGLSQSVTMGIISAKGRRDLELGAARSLLFNQDFLQTDAAINPGNSGGPLINLQGEVVGINTAIASSSGGCEGIGFSIPSNLVRNVMEQLLQYGKVNRAYLGVKLDKFFNAESAARLKLDRRRGARVTEVYPNTPADKSKLQVDDVILTFDGIEIEDEDHLVHVVSLAGVERKVKIVIFREGRQSTVELSLTTRPDPSAMAPTQPGQGTKIDKLGLTLHQIDADLAAQLGYEDTAKGLLVLDIDRNSPLEGDVRLYDLIEEIARTPVASLADVNLALQNAPRTESLVMKVRRRQNGVLKSHLVVLHK